MNTYVQYESPITCGKRVMTKVKVFFQNVKLQGQGQNYGTMWKVLTQGIHMCNMKALLLVRKLWPMLKFFQNYVKLQGQCHEVKNYGTMWKVLSQGVRMCNMKALSLLVRKLWPRLKFFKSRSNFKVSVMRSKITVPCEKYWHKEYTWWSISEWRFQCTY